MMLSILEIYNETIRDLLLNKRAKHEKLEVRLGSDGKVFVPGPSLAIFTLGRLSGAFLVLKHLSRGKTHFIHFVPLFLNAQSLVLMIFMHSFCKRFHIFARIF